MTVLKPRTSLHSVMNSHHLGKASDGRLERTGLRRVEFTNASVREGESNSKHARRTVLLVTGAVLTIGLTFACWLALGISSGLPEIGAESTDRAVDQACQPSLLEKDILSGLRKFKVEDVAIDFGGTRRTNILVRCEAADFHFLLHERKLETGWVKTNVTPR